MLGVIAAALQRSRNDVVHEALSEYIQNHRDELSQLWAQTQKTLAAGDIDALAKLAAPSLQAQAEDLMADLPA